MKKLLTFTDLHLRASPIIGLDPVTRFKDGLTHALAYHPDASGIVLMGDLSHSGTVAEYEILKHTLDDVAIPVTYMMGNHDRRDIFSKVFPKVTLDSSGFVQSAFDIGDWRVITLDTLDGPPYSKECHSGRLCVDRLAWLAGQLEQARDKSIAIFMHHPLGDVGFPGLDSIKLANANDVIDLVRSHPMPVHAMVGHVHRAISGMWGGIPYAIFKSPCHQQPLNFREENTSVAVDEPGAYGLIVFDRSNIIVHSEDFAIAQKDVVPDTDIDG